MNSRCERNFRTAVRLVLAGLALFCAAWLPAQTGGGSSVRNGDGADIILRPDSPEDEIQRAVFDAWFRWKRSLEQGDLGSAERFRDEIIGLLTSGSVGGVNVLGGASAREGFRLLEEGRAEEAKAAFDFAGRVSPDLPQVHYGLSSIALSEKKDVMGWVRGQAAGVGAQVGGIWGSYFLRANLILVALGGLVAFAAAFAIAQFLKYNRLFRHTVFERLSKATTADVAGMLTFAVLFVPLLLWLGPAFLALWWFALLYAYMDGREKVGAWVSVLVLGLIPLGLVGLHGTTSLLDSPVLRAAQSLSSTTVDRRTVQELEERVTNDPDDTRLRFLYSTALQKGGRTPEARQQLRQITEDDRGFERAWNNLGNIHFQEGDLRQATEHYKEAIELSGCYALAHYNLAVAYANDLQMPLYHDHMRDARSCDAALVDQLGSQGEENVVDATLATEEILALVRTDGTGPPGGIGAQLTNPVSLGAFLVLIYLGIRTMKGRGTAPSRGCIKCGRPFCSECQPGAGVSAYCIQCMHLYIKKDGVAPSVRVRKTQEVDRHASRKRWFGRGLNFVLPGAGNIYEGQTLMGILLLVLWCVGIASVFLLGTLVKYPQQVVSLRSILLLGSIGAALVLVWAVSNFLPLLGRR